MRLTKWKVCWSEEVGQELRDAGLEPRMTEEEKERIFRPMMDELNERFLKHFEEIRKGADASTWP